ncbi:hypothetical protein C815_01576 [Firmicutes bacterium M10-2]|nr:hypothetical protein C815_01576 [Firmicutes bacterium M10-2]
MTSSNERPSFAHRFARSLLGKPEVSIPDTTIQSAKVLMKDLTAIPEADWWKYAFSREPMNGRFTDTQRRDMYEKAMICGHKKAEECLAAYGNISPEQLARIMGMDVRFPHMPQSRSRILFAEFKEPDTIYVYQDGIEKGEALFSEKGVYEVLPEPIDLAQILIAHELFHVCELKDPTLWTKTYTVELWKLGWFVNRSPVAVLSEIAAMAFASRLNGLSFSAYVLDAFLAFGYSPIAGSALYDEMMQAAGRKPSLPDWKS